MGDAIAAVRAVVAVLAADGKIDEAERNFLEKLREGLGVAPETVESVLDEVRAGAMTLEFPKDVAERKRLFTMVSAAACADGKVAPEEERFLDLIASRLGVVKLGPGGA